MYFKKLTINNIGPFAGKIELDLSVDVKGRRSDRPIVLFGGKNGAGKTNILESVRLCLYGKQGFGRRLNEPEYQKELGNRIHRNSSATEASVEVVFGYVRNGEALDVLVRRSWNRGVDGRLKETLAVFENGHLMSSVLPDHWQDFIDELLPPTLAQLFFFDGERIQELASEDQNQASQALGDAVRSLFGLSLVDRLSADLAIIERELGESGVNDRARAIAELHAALDEHSNELKAADSKIQNLADRLDKERTAQLKLEEVIRASGGAYARKREQLTIEQRSAENRLKALEERLRKDASDLMPFLLCKNLASALQKDIQLHARHETHVAAATAIQGKAEDIRSAFKIETLLNVDHTLSKGQRQKLSSYVEGLLAQLTSVKRSNAKFRVMDLSRSDLSKLEHLLVSLSSKIEGEARKYAAEMEIAVRQKGAAEEELQKAPSDEDLKPKFVELKAVSERIGTLAAEEDALGNQHRSIQSKIREIESKLAKEAQTAVKNSDIGLVFERSVAAREIVKKFGLQLTQRRLETLAAEVLSTYNLLARKEGMVDHVTIDKLTFNIQLFTRKLGSLPKDRLSAGERQILAISILWALAKLSGRAMPMIVDTPLGRLDSEHRERLVKRYFTQASHQVIVLSTDEEVDEKFYRDLQPHLARSYHLSYDVESGSTSVSSGYFWGKNA